MKTADEYRAEAAQHERQKQESWERSDTDGFLSQWASGINAQLARAKANLAEDGFKGRFARSVLKRADGTEVEARRVETRYGTKWRIDEDDVWMTYGSEIAAKRRGYTIEEVEEIGDAQAMIWAPPGARGLSGADQCRVIVFRADRAKSEGWHYVGRV